jgi:hypothetical protein
MDLHPERVLALRDLRGRRRPDLAVHNESEALEFIDGLGFCYLFTARGFAMPTLWEAICGGTRPVSEQHDDPALGNAWDWKDTLPARKAVYYGKLLRKTPTFVSLPDLPHFYALSSNYGAEDDYLTEYAEGRLSAEAKWVYEALLNEGAQSTTRLRKLAGLEGKANMARFDRALAELQAGLKIVKMGTSDANAWGYCYVYDLLLRQYPQIAEQAQAISIVQAEDHLTLRYLHGAVTVTTGELGRLFGWEPWRLKRLTTRLTAAGAIANDLRWPEQPGTWLARTADVEAIA